jgi:hypothetical protein
MTMTVLEEMTKVMLAVPGPDATDDVVAAWYELKAHLLDRIAAEGGPDADQTGRQAEAAHRRSARLRAMCQERRGPSRSAHGLAA